MPTRGDRHLRAIQLAGAVAALGARLKTIHLITGIPPRQVQALLPRSPAIPRGDAPPIRPGGTTAPTSLAYRRLPLSAPRRRQLRVQGSAGDALVLAYRAYQTGRHAAASPHQPGCRAFSLVSYIDGIWRLPHHAVRAPLPGTRLRVHYCGRHRHTATLAPSSSWNLSPGPSHQASHPALPPAT